VWCSGDKVRTAITLLSLELDIRWLVPMRFDAELVEGTLVSRPQRFLAMVRLGTGKGKARTKNLECFVPNFGKMEGLMVPGCSVLVKKGTSTFEDRRTSHDIVLVRKGRALVAIDPRISVRLVEEAVAGGKAGPLKGQRVQEKGLEMLGSRFDLLLKGRKGQMVLDVRTCITVDEGWTALFPDVQSQADATQMRNLVEATRRGYGAAIAYVIQRGDAKAFSPNDAVDPILGQSLRIAAARGVKVIAFECTVNKREVRIDGTLPVRF
jgi:sugar fermentation stimulation protein A